MKYTLLACASIAALTVSASAQTTSYITWDTLQQTSPGSWVATGSIAGDTGTYTASFNAYQDSVSLDGTFLQGAMGPDGNSGAVAAQNPSSWAVSYSGPNTVTFNEIGGRLFTWGGYTHTVQNINSTVTGATGSWSPLANGAEGIGAGTNVGYREGQVQFNDVASLNFDVVGGGAFSNGALRIGIQATTAAPVPEPSSAALLGLGSLAIFFRRRS